MNDEPLISIVMPARNAGMFIGAAIDSVIQQTWKNWELLVVDNASSDGTADIVRAVRDPRIRSLYEPRPGVGHARNTALLAARGAFYCFLDADDLLPPSSLADRAALLLTTPSAHFADGAMEAFGPDGRTVWVRAPHFQGDPLPELLALNSSCFLGNTWMIRRIPGEMPLFRTDMTHAEDLFYCMSIANQGLYTHATTVTLRYRVGLSSAMSDLSGLHEGYRRLLKAMRGLDPAPNAHVTATAWRKVRRIMFRSYLKRGRVVAALRAWREPEPG